jgi:hypothetical protein
MPQTRTHLISAVQRSRVQCPIFPLELLNPSSTRRKGFTLHFSDMPVPEAGLEFA